MTISRARGSLSFPANFILVAAMNPCPCGYFRDPQRACTCQASNVTPHRKWISRPMLDRIDALVEVPRVDFDKLADDHIGETSERIRARVESACALQQVQFDGTGLTFSAEMGPGEVREICYLDDTPGRRSSRR